MNLPVILIACNDCADISPEMSCYPPDEVWWLPEYRRWVCTECWANYQDVDDPVLSVAEVLDTPEEMERRVLTTLTKLRLTK